MNGRIHVCLCGHGNLFSYCCPRGTGCNKVWSRSVRFVYQRLARCPPCTGAALEGRSCFDRSLTISSAATTSHTLSHRPAQIWETVPFVSPRTVIHSPRAIALAILAPVGLYAAFVGLLTIPFIQNQVIYLNKVTLTWGKDLNIPK